MSDLLGNMMRNQAARVVPIVASHGLVSSYDPNTMTAKVILQPDGVETGWLPINGVMIGNGWGMVFPPTVGDQVVVVLTDSKRGKPGTGSIVARHYNDTQRPPGPVQSGEMWLVHQTGSALKLTNDGKVLVHGNDTIGIDTTVGVNIGNIAGLLNRLIDERLKQVYDAHTHTAVQTGSGTSGPPTTPLDLSAVATTITKAN